MNQNSQSWATFSKFNQVVTSQEKDKPKGNIKFIGTDTPTNYFSHKTLFPLKLRIAHLRKPTDIRFCIDCQ